MRAPVLTRDLEQARRDLSECGYCLVADALSQDVLAQARERLCEQAEGEIEHGIDFRDGGPGQRYVDQDGHAISNATSVANGGVNQRVFVLANKGRCFLDMVDHPLTDDLVGHVLGREFIVSTLSANIAKPGGVRMGLHTDQWWMPQPVRPGADYVRASEITRRPVAEFLAPDLSLGIAPPVVANTMWMLSDFTSENGATEVVPGSHLSGAHPDPARQAAYPIVQAEAPAGSLMVFDGRLWHGTGANTGGPDRLGYLATFCAPQFRQQENQTLALDRALWPKLSDKLRARLGFKVWNAYGRVSGDFAGIVEPEPERVGELNARRPERLGVEG